MFPYKGETKIESVGEDVDRGMFLQREFEATNDGRKLFRIFRLAPRSTKARTLPTIVCFMGHGKVRQILKDRDSYQHACAAQFAERGYLVFRDGERGHGTGTRHSP